MAERMRPEVKFTATCECGKKTPRPVTGYTANRWMENHIREHWAAEDSQ